MFAPKDVGINKDVRRLTIVVYYMGIDSMEPTNNMHMGQNAIERRKYICVSGKERIIVMILGDN